jgi:hypothetical protein
MLKLVATFSSNPNINNYHVTLDDQVLALLNIALNDDGDIIQYYIVNIDDSSYVVKPSTLYRRHRLQMEDIRKVVSELDKSLFNMIKQKVEEKVLYWNLMIKSKLKMSFMVGEDKTDHGLNSPLLVQFDTEKEAIEFINNPDNVKNINVHMYKNGDMVESIITVRQTKEFWDR